MDYDYKKASYQFFQCSHKGDPVDHKMVVSHRPVVGQQWKVMCKGSETSTTCKKDTGP